MKREQADGGRTPFLRQVAEHYFDCGNMEKMMLIFPNRRSMTFFRKHIGDISCERGEPCLLPSLTSVSDFYSKASGLVTADRISLLLNLYDSYSRLNRKAEPLDDFIYWGDVLLADFEDIDKYLVDSEMLFANISDLKAITQNLHSYADERQIKAVTKLAGHFEDWNRETASDSDARKRFLAIWELLLPLYSDFRESVASKGMAYSGMIYRAVAQRAAEGEVVQMLRESFPGTEKFVFVGLNILSRSEEVTMKKMKDAGLAEFCWDWCGDIVTDSHNNLFRFMRGNVTSFPNAFTVASTTGLKPAVHSVSVPSASGQTKLISSIISQVNEKQRGLDFAIVLADESQLAQVLSGIPSSVESVNVTMGCPMASSPWGTLMKDILLMQLNMREKDGKWFFYHRHTYDILSSAIVRGCLDEQQTAVVDRIYKEARYYIPEEDFGEEGTLLRAIFVPVVTSKSREPGDLRNQIGALADYQLRVITAIIAALGDRNDLVKEFAMQYYLCVNRLKGLSLSVLPRTWVHLLDRLTAGVSVPFEGEPLGGMQVMGPLETRALDFRHIVVMNANEGVFPRHSSSPSFIPPELRAAFDLPTYDRQDAVWAYYFYRLIARAENVWMLYDSRTSGLTTGEESRFIKQLRYLYPDKCELDFTIAQSDVRSLDESDSIPKTEEDVEVFRKKALSASSIGNYLQCPVKFYYNTIKGLSAKDDVLEEMDRKMLGIVCHAVLESLYTSEEEMLSDGCTDKRGKSFGNRLEPKVITLDYLRKWYREEELIRRKVNSLICYNLRCIDVSGINVISSEVAVNFVRKVLDSDIRLLERMGLDRLAVIATELSVEGTIAGHAFKGFIDRLDLIGGTLRVVDYKTGSDNPATLGQRDVEKVFSSFLENKAAMQFFIYDRLVRQCSLLAEYDGLPLINSMYAMKYIFKGGVDCYDTDEEFMKEMEERLRGTLDEIQNIDISFTRCKESDCKYCDFKSLCGRVDKEQ